MIKKIICALAICMPLLAGAQATLSSKEMIAITPYLSNTLELPADAMNSLRLKLSQTATQNGFGSTSNDFVLSANVVTTGAEATATAPIQYVVDLEVSFFVVNMAEKLIVDEMSFTVQGIDRIQDKAVIMAINQIKPQSPKVRIFMDNVRSQIITYYDTRIPALLTKAQAYAGMNQHALALAVLAGVPESCDQYPIVAEQMVAIYGEMTEVKSAQALQQAQAYAATKDYDAAVTELAYVDPASSSAPQARELIGQIADKVQKSDENKMQLAMKLYDDNMDLERRRIEAARSIGLEHQQSANAIGAMFENWLKSR